MNDVQRLTVLEACLFRVGIDVFRDPLQQCVLQARFHRPESPLFDSRLNLVGLRAGFELLGEGDQSLGCIGTTVQQAVLDINQQLFVDLFIDFELPCVDDSHVKAGLNCVVEECRVHRLTHDIVASE